MDQSDQAPTSLEDVAFSDVLPGLVDLSAQSLAELSGDTSLAFPTFHSGLTKRVAEAWIVPMSQLTCAQVCMLAGQKLGMEWLATPVAVFVRANPTAECRFYPGDLSHAALQAHAELLRYAPNETRSWLSGAFDWMPAAYEFSEALLSEAPILLADARRRARMH